MPLASRGRPRDPRIAAQVLSAAVAELAHAGTAGFSINRVAGRAGVDKRGIYSRWECRDALIIDALGTLAPGLVPPRAATLADDLAALAPSVAAVFTTPRLQILQRCAAEAKTHPAIYDGFRRDSVDRCVAVVEDAFHRARRRQEIPTHADPARAAEAFLGMVLARATLLGDEAVLEHADQQAVIDFCLAAVESTPAGAYTPIGS